MPSLVSEKPIVASAIAPSITYTGLIILRSSLKLSPYTSAGLDDVQNIVASVIDGAVDSIHQCTANAVVFKLDGLPLQLASSGPVLTYRAGWVAGDPKALRADLGRDASIEKEANTVVNISGTNPIDIADLYLRKV